VSAGGLLVNRGSSQAGAHLEAHLAYNAATVGLMVGVIALVEEELIICSIGHRPLDPMREDLRRHPVLMCCLHTHLYLNL